MFRIYKNDGTQVVEGESPLTITGLEPETVVAAGDYQAVRVVDGTESEKVDVPGFTTLAEEPAQLNAVIAEKPTKNSTVDEIKQWLTKHDIDFSGVTLKDDLLALIPA